MTERIVQGLDLLQIDDAAMPLPRRYRAEFVGSATPGLRLVGKGWPAQDGWSYQLSDEQGRELFRASLQTDQGDFVGG